MTATDDLVAGNASHAAGFNRSYPQQPTRKLALVTCMDARVDLPGMLGIGPGEAHVLRNAGGVVTDDTIRSLSISQHRLGTREVMVIQHTDCGMLTLTDEEFKSSLQRTTGLRPTWAVEAFTDLEDNVRQSVRRVTTSPFLVHRDAVRGFVYDVFTGRLAEVR